MAMFFEPFAVDAVVRTDSGHGLPEGGGVIHMG